MAIKAFLPLLTLQSPRVQREQALTGLRERTHFTQCQPQSKRATELIPFHQEGTNVKMLQGFPYRAGEMEEQLSGSHPPLLPLTVPLGCILHASPAMAQHTAQMRNEQLIKSQSIL